MKVASMAYEPPVLTETDLARIQEESQRLHDAFTARTTSMKIVTADDLKVVVR